MKIEGFHGFSIPFIHFIAVNVQLKKPFSKSQTVFPATMVRKARPLSGMPWKGVFRESEADSFRS